MFNGNGSSRTSDFEVTVRRYSRVSEGEDLVYVELYKSHWFTDIWLTWWLALTPTDIVAAVLRISVLVVDHLKKGN